MANEQSPKTALQEAFEVADGLDEPIDEKLASYSNASSKYNPIILDAYERFIARLKASDAGGETPGPGDEMPDFLLPDHEGNLLALSNMLSMGPVVVSFNRGHWCPYCRLELRALARIHPAIKEAGATLVSIVPEIAEFASAMHEKNRLPFNVLCDIDHGYALSMGLVVWVGEELQAAYSQRGLNLPIFQRNDSWFLSIPATFVVDGDGRIKRRLADPDFRHRLSIKHILDSLSN